MGVGLARSKKMAHLCATSERNTGVAQLVEHRSPKPSVGRSSRSSRATKRALSYDRALFLFGQTEKSAYK